MGKRRTRLAIRIVHLTIGAALGLMVYLPVSWSAGLKLALMVVGVPLAVLSGVYLGQQGRIRRWLRRSRAEPVERARVRG